jgi:hypothetical protein
LGPDHLDVASGRETLADLYCIERRYSDAERLLNIALATREKVSGPESIDVCLSLSYLAAVNDLRRCRALPQAVPRHPGEGAGRGPCHRRTEPTGACRLYRKLGRDGEAPPLYNRAIAVLGYNHPEAILAAISAGDYARAAHALGQGSVGAGISDAVVQQIRRTFFGQVTDLRRTGYRYTDQMGINSRASSFQTTTELLLVGEAAHGSGLWQPFLATMLPEGRERKLQANILLGLAWKQ